MPKVFNPTKWFSQYFPTAITTRQIQEWGNIWWRVGVARSLSPRDPFCEFIRDLGMTNIEPALLHKEFPDFRDHLVFFFPERWMTVPEQHMFVPALRQHPQIRNNPMTIIEMLTNSPLLVQNFIRDDVRIISTEEGEARHREIDQRLGLNVVMGL